MSLEDATAMQRGATETESSGGNVYECRNIFVSLKNDMSACTIIIRHKDMNSTITFNLSDRSEDIKAYLISNVDATEEAQQHIDKISAVFNSGGNSSTTEIPTIVEFINNIKNSADPNAEINKAIEILNQSLAEYSNSVIENHTRLVQKLYTELGDVLRRIVSITESGKYLNSKRKSEDSKYSSEYSDTLWKKINTLSDKITSYMTSSETNPDEVSKKLLESKVYLSASSALALSSAQIG
jgi:hypothetical protein